MPELVNYLPFPNFRYYATDPRGVEFGVIIIKGTFEIGEDGQLAIAEEQAPMVFTDTCHGAVNKSSLWHPSDLVPRKPAADIIVNAVARTPDGNPQNAWECGIRVEGPEGILVEKRLRVTGPRMWVPRWRRALDEEERLAWRRHRKLFRGWELSEPEPVTEVALRYELAFGGTIEKGKDENGNARFDGDPRNPIGRGLIDAEWTDHTLCQPAPQIEATDEPIRDPYQACVPQSFGPIPPAWEPRLPRAGTFDEAWEQTVWPRWPPDYDFSFHNSAHPALVAPRHLKQGDCIKLTNLFFSKPVVEFSIPQFKPIVQFIQPNGRVEQSDSCLDTCFIDLPGRKPSDGRVYLSWRVNFRPNAFMTAILGVAPGSAAAENDPDRRKAS